MIILYIIFYINIYENNVFDTLTNLLTKKKQRMYNINKQNFKLY